MENCESSIMDQVKKKIRGKLLFTFCAFLCAWLFLPGLGPDLAQLELRYGWKLGSENWRGPLSREPQIMLPKTRAAQQLAELEVRLPHTEKSEKGKPYQREKFGQAWADTDHNGCDTRNDILRRDLQNVQFKAKTQNCLVISGTLHDPYSGEVLQFYRGNHTSQLIQIDHVVALADAWRSGAQDWNATQRLQFANDPENLLAVSGAQNKEKGAANASEWLPANSDYHCHYIARQIAVKHQWKLSVTTREHKSMARVLQHCTAK